MPGNEGRDYVLRRIIRRAVSEAGHLGLEPARGGRSRRRRSSRAGARPTPSWPSGPATCADVLGAEAEQFARTLSQGRRLLSEVIERSGGSGTVSGEDAFRLYDTFGFPLDLTLEAAQRRGPRRSTRAASRR